MFLEHLYKLHKRSLFIIKHTLKANVLSQLSTLLIESSMLILVIFL